MEARPVLKLGFDADWRVGFNIHGEVIVAESENVNQRLFYKGTFHKYHIQPGSAYINIWHRELPGNIRPDFHKAMSTAGIFFAQNICYHMGPRPAILVSSDGSEVLETRQHEGELLTCLHPTRLVYAVSEGDRGYKVEIEEEDGSKRTLRPKAGHTWTKLLSVCQDNHGRTAIVDQNLKEKSNTEHFPRIT